VKIGNRDDNMTRFSRGLRESVILLALANLVACSDTSIVPSVRGEHRAFISLGSQVSDAGALDKSEVETLDSCSAAGGCAFAVHVTRYTKVRLVGKAVDDIAGIKTLKLAISRGATVLMTNQVSHSISANGKAPGQFGFAGSDNSGGFGVLAPIEFVASDYTTVVVEVMNFEGNVNKLIVDYTPHDPVTASISVSPAEISPGEQAFLSISGSPASSFVISPPIALVPWPIPVSPSVTTTYALTVTQPFPSVKVGFPNPPPAVGQTVHPTSKTVTATLKVKQPPPPSANPATLTFYLQLQPVGLGATNFFGPGTVP